MNHSRKILVAPLDWGLGHASRCVPLIQRHLDAGDEVVVATKGATQAFLQSRFPQVRILPLRGYGIQYSKHLPLLLKLLLQLPRFFFAIRNEHQWLQALLENEHFNQIISDNRYGLWSKKTHCVLITHQLSPVLPAGLKIMRGMINRILAMMINRFDECWIPDIEGGQSISGDLSTGNSLVKNQQFIGWLSRFQNNGLKSNLAAQPVYEHVVLISGPEPHRSLMEKQMTEEALASGVSTIIFAGKPLEQTTITNGSLIVVPNASDDIIRYHLLHAKKITCRSGYSTLMDLAVLGLKATLIPTPGQTEQEYLAERMTKIDGWTVRGQY